MVIIRSQGARRKVHRLLQLNGRRLRRRERCQGLVKVHPSSDSNRVLSIVDVIPSRRDTVLMQGSILALSNPEAASRHHVSAPFSADLLIRTASRTPPLPRCHFTVLISLCQDYSRKCAVCMLAHQLRFGDGRRGLVVRIDFYPPADDKIAHGPDIDHGVADGKRKALQRAGVLQQKRTRLTFCTNTDAAAG